MNKEIDYNKKQIEDGNISPEALGYLIMKGVSAFQEEQGLTVDGMAGPMTQAKLAALLNPVVVTPHVDRGIGYYPTGKGVYIRQLSKCGTPAQAVKTALDNDLSFVVIGSVWIDSRVWAAGKVIASRFNKPADLERYGKAFRDAGIEVWVWGYPYPKHERKFVDIMMADALTSGAVGLILDPEKPYRKKHAYANILMQMLKSELEQSGLAVGVTSYGSAWWFEDFPYEEFAQIPGTFGSPQIYDNGNDLPATHAHRSFEAYKAAGYDEIVISGPGYNKTTAQWKKLAATFPTGNRALIIWDWNNLRMKKNAHLWAVIREYKV